MELKKGETYYWCSCGHSKSQPFCDGSHKTLKSPYVPLKFIYDGETDEGKDTKARGLCGCKLNAYSKGPFCDGSHKRIDFDNLNEKYKAGFNDN